MSASLVKVHPSPIDNVFDKVVSSEFVSGSNQMQNTLINNYKVISSVGSYNKELYSKTPNGYGVFTSVQGTLISLDEVK